MFAALQLRGSGTPAPDDAGSEAPEARLVALARDSSPRVEIVRAGLVVLDASGLASLFGHPREFGEHVMRDAARRGLSIGMAIAATQTAALVLAVGREGLTVAPRGREARLLATLPLGTLDRLGGPSPAWSGSPPAAGELARLQETLARWGVRTLGDLAALPPADLFERLGEAGVRWRRVARGEDVRPLVRMPEEEPFEQTLVLEWPIEGLEPLSFVIARLLDPLCARLERGDRGAVVLHTWLRLVTREVHARAVRLPAPIRDPKVLRTLVLLDLESHPPPAGIDQVTLAVEPAPGRILQYSLLARPLPSPDQLSTLMARLTALMGERRCGSPALLDSPRPGACAVVPFSPEQRATSRAVAAGPLLTRPDRVALDTVSLHHGEAAVLRRFPRPVPARVTTEHGRPIRVATWHRGLAGGRVETAAGPWRTSGEWWHSARSGTDPRDPDCRASWDRDEWEVALGDRAVYRLYRDRATRQWFVEGCWD
jgi:protein ImuB